MRRDIGDHIMWENDEFKITFKEDAIHGYERIMLTSGECNYLIPMSFIGENDKETAYYNCSGFSALSTYSVEKTEDALFIIEKVLLILGNIAAYLITPAKVTLTTDTVFYNQETNEIKIAYVPLPGEGINIRRNLLKFISQLKADIKDEHVSYLDKIGRIIHYNHFHVNEIIGQIGLLKRELYSQTNASS